MLTRRLSTTLIAVALLAFAACGEDREGDVESKGGTGTTGAGTSTTGTGTSTTGTGTSTTPAAGGKAVATVRVSETEFALDPKNPKVAKAGVVEFVVTNAGKVPHALEVEGHGGEAETDTIQPGSKARLKVDLSERGSYEWYCPIGDHKQRGMKGRIAVAGGGPVESHEDPERDHGSTEKDESGGRGDSY